MKLLKLNFRQTTNTYINDVPKVQCFGNSPRCLKTYIPTRNGQDLCVRCLQYYDPKCEYTLVDIKKVNYRKIKIVLET